MPSTPFIDNGNPFDWGRASVDYALYRDIYPDSLFEKLHRFGIGTADQTIVDLGTGTGAIPRFLANHGARFIGIDPSVQQIEQAKRLSKGLEKPLEWNVAAAEQTGLPDGIADVVMACQCFFYFDKARAIPEILRIMKPSGRFAKISMIWLPFEDAIARKTEELVLKYNPDWTGAHFRREQPAVPDWSKEHFIAETLHTYDAYIQFSQDTWRGRIRACRGIGASSIPPDAKLAFDNELKEYLNASAPETFEILHQVMIEIYRKPDGK